MTPSRDIARLLDIMARLRTPGTGCPWDLEQDFATIAPYTIEEAYEVADAIARHDGVASSDAMRRHLQFSAELWQAVISLGATEDS